eukprot:m.1125943 g.1125943  ORF g.1125943 m.1125943 type:complete len:76 (+) comp24410_c0_seq23:4109-4336(+)
MIVCALKPAVHRQLSVDSCTTVGPVVVPEHTMALGLHVRSVYTFNVQTPLQTRSPLSVSASWRGTVRKSACSGLG